MDPLPIGKIKICLGKFTKKCPKKLFSCLGPVSIVLLLGVFVLGAALNLKSLYIGDFSFLSAKASGQDLFATGIKNFLIESPEMTLVQGNSLIGNSPPATVTTQVLGSVLGGIETTDLKSEGEVFEYLVQKGDTLSSVSEKFNISLNTILWANNLSGASIIRSGKKLIILPISGTIHLVKNGDTLGGLAKMYKTDLQEIISFNKLSDEGDIFIGDALIIPGGKKPASVPKTASIPLGKSYFIFPVEGKITQGLHGVFGNAVDIANKCGKIVVTAAGGTVQRAGPIAIGGNRVTILHPNGTVTYYGHLSAIVVVSGQQVTTGQVIGYIGNTGYTTGCHLHFEVRGARNFLADYSVGSYLSWKK